MQILNRKLDTNTTVIVVTGIVAITCAYLFGPHEFRDELMATVGGLATVVAGIARALFVSEGRGE